MKLQVQTLQTFATWVQERANKRDTFKVPRFMLGPNAYNFMLWHLCGLFDQTGATQKQLEALIEECRPYPEAVVKECLIVVTGPGQNNRSFRYNHFVPNATRTHLVLNGEGCLHTNADSVMFTAGDVFTIKPLLLNTDMHVSQVERHSTHVVVMWAGENDTPIWVDYART